LIDIVGPLIPNAPLIASASAWGGLSRTSSGFDSLPWSLSRYQRSPERSPELQLATTTPQRSGGICWLGRTPQFAIASSAAFSAKSKTGSLWPSGCR
jgi:hypothetical protein